MPHPSRSGNLPVPTTALPVLYNFHMHSIPQEFPHGGAVFGVVKILANERPGSREFITDYSSTMNYNPDICQGF